MALKLATSLPIAMQSVYGGIVFEDRSTWGPASIILGTRALENQGVVLGFDAGHVHIFFKFFPGGWAKKQ